jgi:dimethylsulfone monooxygenase
MFGIAQREHDQRYEFADEWVTVVKRLWTEDRFDFAGQFFTVPDG